MTIRNTFKAALKAVLLAVLVLAVAVPAGADKKRADQFQADESFIGVEQGSAPSNPSSGSHKIYFDTSGDLNLLDSAGVVSTFGSAAFEDIGTSGDAVPKLNAANTWSALQTWQSGSRVSNSGNSDLGVHSVNGLMEFTFKGQNDAAEEIVYGKLRGQQSDRTDGSEDFTMQILGVTAGGIDQLIASLSGVGTTFGSPTGGDQGAGTINAEGVFVNGGAITGAWTNSGAIDLTSGSPTSVSLLSGASSVSEIEIYITGMSFDMNNQAPMLQIGDPGGLESSGYNGGGLRNSNSNDVFSTNSAGFKLSDGAIPDSGANSTYSITLRHMGSNLWVLHGEGFEDVNNFQIQGFGDKTLSAALDRLTLTTSGGTATFDGGTAYVRHR